MVRRRLNVVEALLNRPHSSDPSADQADFERASDQMSWCLSSGGTMTSDRRLMIGAFAEQLYRRRFPTLPALAPVQPLTAVTAPEDAPFVVTVAFANCLIEAAPQAADALVRTRIGTDEERAAFQLLAPQFQPCLDSGNTFVITRLALRMAMADQLYRRARAAPPPAAAVERR